MSDTPVSVETALLAHRCFDQVRHWALDHEDAAVAAVEAAWASFRDMPRSFGDLEGSR